MPLQLPNGQVYRPDQPDTTTALEDAQTALEEGTAEVVPAEPLPCVTAFIIYMLPDGRWQVSTDLDVPLVPERKPHGDDFTSGCATTMRDVATQETVQAAASIIIPNVAQTILQNIPSVMLQVGQAVRQQTEADRVAEALAKDKQRRGGRTS